MFFSSVSESLKDFYQAYAEIGGRTLITTYFLGMPNFGPRKM